MKSDRSTRSTRRDVLKSGAGAALGGVLGLGERASAGPRFPISVYEALGVKHVINATGTMTTLGGSLMPSEVVAAWVEASYHILTNQPGPGYENRGEHEAPALDVLLKQGFPVRKAK